MKFDKFADLYSEQLGNHTLKANNEKLPENLLLKPGKIMDLLSDL